MTAMLEATDHSSILLDHNTSKASIEVDVYEQKNIVMRKSSSFTQRTLLLGILDNSLSATSEQSSVLAARLGSVFEVMDDWKETLGDVVVVVVVTRWQEP